MAMLLRSALRRSPAGLPPLLGAAVLPRQALPLLGAAVLPRQAPPLLGADALPPLLGAAVLPRQAPPLLGVDALPPLLGAAVLPRQAPPLLGADALPPLLGAAVLPRQAPPLLGADALPPLLGAAVLPLLGAAVLPRQAPPLLGADALPPLLGAAALPRQYHAPPPASSRLFTAGGRPPLFGAAVQRPAPPPAAASRPFSTGGDTKTHGAKLYPGKKSELGGKNEELNESRLMKTLLAVKWKATRFSLKDIALAAMALLAYVLLSARNYTKERLTSASTSIRTDSVFEDTPVMESLRDSIVKEIEELCFLQEMHEEEVLEDLIHLKDELLAMKSEMMRYQRKKDIELLLKKRWWFERVFLVT